MAEDTLQTRDSKKQDMTAKPRGKPEKANPRLDRMGKPISRTDRATSSSSSHNKTPKATHFSDPLFDQYFDELLESFDNLEPFNNLED